ncbi:hypothetical protein [Methylobacterium iners]|uniref:Uncharacterized protein n=1 Tax=Methylobacterium iners TaxID=418707 RepID=A0ABQ4RQV4_9HYPH|nr:hypothetical protein [Methylobacterium iners]GJD93146.1 hypothetical protein OCOJLMKI_0336 [Methylobacterium iners]
MKVWTITLNTAPDRSLFCEVGMRGRNREAGGDYSIRYRFERGVAPVLIVSATALKLSVVENLSLAVDGRALGTLKTRRTRLAGDEVLAASIDAGRFDGTILPALLKPDAIGLELSAGGRLLQAPIQGWGAVMGNLEACMARLPG